MKLIIDRAKWLRGEDSWKSCLFRVEDRKMCCLGFLSLACGAVEAEITACPSPSSVCKQALWPSGLLDEGGNNTLTCTSLMEVNDDPDPSLSNTEREAQLTYLFQQLNIEVEFTG